MPIRRSVLTTPGSNEEMMAKAAASAADAVVLDLEDSVTAQAKSKARNQVADALGDHDWTGTVVGVRINDLTSPGTYRDLIEVFERGGEQLDVVVVPKTSGAMDVLFVDTLLHQIEQERGITPKIGIEAQIETPRGIQQVDAIARASERLEALIFGQGDLGVAQGVTFDRFDSEEGHQMSMKVWRYARNRIVVAARANDLDPIDGPYGDFSDKQGLRRESRESRSMGFDGKWVIHPSQIEIVNEEFSPTTDEIKRASKLLESLERAASEGKGATGFEGKMIDAVSIKRAERTLERAASIGLIDARDDDPE